MNGRPTLLRGHGEPVTVFAHGFGSGIPDTRPYASGVSGTNVFYTARGHDGVVTDDFSYAALAGDLRAVADEYGATQAFGVSMGAGALTHLVADDPDRFDRLVFFLPAVVDVGREQAALDALSSLHDAIETGDVDKVADAVRAGLTDTVSGTPGAHVYAKNRARTLLLPSLRGCAKELATQVAVTDRELLAKVTAQVLVIGCRGDRSHPADVAEYLADSFPHADLHIFESPDTVWTERDALRALISGFLNC